MGLFDFFKPKNECKPEPSFKERRFLPRWQINCLGQLRWEGLDDYIPCEVKNLNLKGLALSLSQALPTACSKITLHLGKDYVLNVEIAILWSRQAKEKNTYGLKFTKIRDSDKEKIYQMMRQDFPDQLQVYR